LGFVLTDLFVFRITHAGTAEACFCFFISRIFLELDFRAAIKTQARQALFK
jgi:hypothetical protein